jgi:hypothetical protein
MVGETDIFFDWKDNLGIGRAFLVNDRWTRQSKDNVGLDIRESCNIVEMSLREPHPAHLMLAFLDGVIIGMPSS